MDIAPDLYEKVNNKFTNGLANSTRIKRVLKKIEDGKADYKDVNTLAEYVGEALEQAFKLITEDDLPNGRMYYNIADRVVRPNLEEEFDILADASEIVQKTLNKKAGLGLNAIRPIRDNNRIQGIIDRVSDADNYNDIRWILGEPVINYAQSVVTDSIKLNASTQQRAGLNPRIIREAEAPGVRTVVRGKKRISYKVPCVWCARLAGTYDYGEVSNTGNDVFRRHENCRCLITYDPGDGRRQNVHTKEWIKADEEEANERIAKAEAILAEEEQKRENGPIDEEYAKVKNALEVNNVAYKEVTPLKTKLTEAEIIDRVGGGDKTSGSCSSLAFTYIANKGGHDVLDFRGGNSQFVFSQYSKIENIAKMRGVKSVINVDFNGYKAAHAVLDTIADEKEYYFTAGRHAAVVKKIDGVLHYLELQQNPALKEPLYINNYGNMFKPLNDTVLKERFKVKRSQTIKYVGKMEQNALIIDAESLQNNSDFLELLGYINTDENKQKKGVGGFAK